VAIALTCSVPIVGPTAGLAKNLGDGKAFSWSSGSHMVEAEHEELPSGVGTIVPFGKSNSLNLPPAKVGGGAGAVPGVVVYGSCWTIAVWK
jgi:hypothetical protein